jgi:hypothetical protein
MSPRIYSDSILEAFSQCFAKGSDALGRRHGKAGPARIGQAIHALLEVYVKHLESVGLMCDRDWLIAKWNEIRWQLNGDDEKDATLLVYALAEVDLPFVLEAVDEYHGLTVERRRFFRLDGAEVHPDDVANEAGPLFAMTPDVVWYSRTQDGGALCNVLDWKTHWIVEALDVPDRRRQMQRYAAALWRADGARGEVLVHTYHVRRRWQETAVAPFTEEELENFWNVLIVAPITALEAIFAAGKTLDERTVGAHCVLCDMRNGCDAFRRFPVEPMRDCEVCEGKGFVETPRELDGFSVRADCGHCNGGKVLVDAATLLKMAAIADARATAATDALRRHVAANGPVEVDGWETALSTTATYEWDRDALEKKLHELLHPDFAKLAFKATKTSIEDAFKKAGFKPKEREKLMSQVYAIARRVKDTTTMRVKAKGNERESEEV